MNLSNSDKEFFENLNRSLANSLGDALKGSIGGSGGGGGKSGVADDAKDEGLKRAFKAVAAGMGTVIKTAVGTSFNVLAGALEKSTQNTLAFGDTLARSAAATNRQALITSRSIDAQGKVVQNLPKVAREFGDFGIGLKAAGRSIDDAIRANVKNTGVAAQKFLATSQGLGNSLSNTNQFLATQTNVLGKSTDASTEFGQSILGLASSNGILADSILEAVNAFTKTTREQTAIFGANSAQIVARAVAGAEAVSTGAGTADLIRALTSPENILKLPGLAGRLGITPVTATQLRDPGRMQEFLEEAIPALARFGEQEVLGQSAETALPLTQQLAASFGEAFSLINLQRASLLMGDLAEKGVGVSHLFQQQALTTEELDKAQKDITSTSHEAMTNMAMFNVELALAPSYFKAIGVISDELREADLSAEWIRQQRVGQYTVAELLDGFALADAGARALGTTAINVANQMSGGISALTAAVVTAGAMTGGRMVKSAFRNRMPTPVQPITAKADFRTAAGQLSDDALKQAGITRIKTKTGQIQYRGPGGQAMSFEDVVKQAADPKLLKTLGLSDDMVSTIVRSRGFQAAGKFGRIAGPGMAIAMPFIDEALKEDGDMGRASARAAGGLVSFGVGAKIGAGLGAMTGPAAPIAVPVLSLVGGTAAALGADELISDAYDSVAGWVSGWFSDDEEEKEQAKEVQETQADYQKAIAENTQLMVRQLQDMGELNPLGFATGMQFAPSDFQKKHDPAYNR